MYILCNMNGVQKMIIYSLYKYMR